MHQKLLTTSLTLLIATQPVDNNKLKPSPSNPGMPSWDTSPGKENRFFLLLGYISASSELTALITQVRVGNQCLFREIKKQWK